MDTPPETRALSLTLSWGGTGRRRERTVSIASAARVAAVLALCGACFKAGRWVGRLEESVPPPASAVVVVEAASKSPLPENGGLAPGGVPGENDVITPLNARDPSSLVMGISASEPPPSRISDPPEVPDVEPPLKVYKKPRDIKPSRRF